MGAKFIVPPCVPLCFSVAVCVSVRSPVYRWYAGALLVVVYLCRYESHDVCSVARGANQHRSAPVCVPCFAALAT